MARTILIVDDDTSAREVLVQMLEPEGYEVIQAESGEEALELAGSLHVDAFLLDIGMPRMNGIDLCRALRRMERYSRVPIIFLTGQADDVALEEAFASGGDDFLGKPSTMAGVRVRLKNHLQRMDYLQRLERMRRHGYYSMQHGYPRPHCSWTWR